MNYLLYEVWAEDDIGHLELVDTTASQKEAFDLAKKCLEDGYIETTVYQENEDGESVVIKQFQNSPT
jgi:hypothetical protein